MRTRTFGRIGPLAAWLLVMLFILMTAGCATTQYDATTDAQATNLQKEIDGHMMKMIAAARDKARLAEVIPSKTGQEKVFYEGLLQDAIKRGSYEQNKDFYPKTESDLSILETRVLAESSGKPGKEWSGYFSKLHALLESLWLQHQQYGNLSKTAWETSRAEFMAALVPIVIDQARLKIRASSSQGASSPAPAAKAGATPSSAAPSTKPSGAASPSTA